MRRWLNTDNQSQAISRLSDADIRELIAEAGRVLIQMSEDERECASACEYIRSKPESEFARRVIFANNQMVLNEHRDRRAK